jgi:hypothetical protein
LWQTLLAMLCDLQSHLSQVQMNEKKIENVFYLLFALLNAKEDAGRIRFSYQSADVHFFNRNIFVNKCQIHRHLNLQELNQENGVMY